MARRNEDDPKRLLDPKTIAKISQLDLRAKQVVEGFLTGMHKSPLFGQSVEFVQHREYVPGDDLRHVDWTVWSKTDRYYVKQYEADTNTNVSILMDISRSMQFANKGIPKIEYGCFAAACMAYLAQRQRDRVAKYARRSRLQTASPLAGTGLAEAGCQYSGQARLPLRRRSAEPAPATSQVARRSARQSRESLLMTRLSCRNRSS